MSAYKDFVSDFARRCMGVLAWTDEHQDFHDREVTLLFMAASAGFVIPFERIQSDLNHPSRDKIKLKETKKYLEVLMAKIFLGSELHPDTATEWIRGKLPSFNGNPDEYPELVNGEKIGRHEVRSTLKILRNALAHGNLYTIGDPIIRIIFVSELRPDKDLLGYNYLSVPPDHFRKFLDKWCEILATHNLQSLDLNEILEKAA